MTASFIFEEPMNLEEILVAAWHMLNHGVTDSNDPFHTPVLGTSGPHGPNLRTVVLRQVMPDERLLLCHTDRRSPKVQEIGSHSNVSWLFYHPEQKVQLRMTGPARLHLDDELATEQWATTQAMSRRLYCVVDVPGTPMDEPSSGLPEALGTRLLTPEESEEGRQNFAVIACKVDFIDWLYLRTQGHRRAQFTWQNEQFNATWVIP